MKLLLLSLLLGPQEPSATRQPNVLVLFADDAGYADFSFQEHKDPALAKLTPRIGQIAQEGIVLRDFHTSGSVCSPSRAGLMTGRYQQEFGHEQNLPIGFVGGGIAAGGRSLAERMQAAGCATGLIGKWHLGYRAEDHPNERGWTEFIGLLQGSRSYHAKKKISDHQALQHNGEQLPEDGYVTDRLGSAAIEFLEAHSKEPFFLFVSFTAPHGPLEPRTGDLKDPLLAGIEDGKRHKYAGLVHALDQNVGRILDALDRLGLTRETIVVFTNDNGGQTETGALNLPLRGKKGDLYEGGIRVPAAVRWPGRIAPGSESAWPCSTLDLAPTLLAAVGSQEADDLALAGVNLLAHWQGGKAPEERPLFWRQGGKGGSFAVRLGRWKLLEGQEGQGPELYDLAEDPSESKNLAEQRQEVVAHLRSLGMQWQEGLVEPNWGLKN